MVLLDEHLKTTKEKERSDILNKQGRFRISYALLQDNPDAVKATMSHMVITRCEFLFNSQCHVFSYTALSDLFDKIKMGEQIPEYIIEIDNKGNVSARKRATG